MAVFDMNGDHELAELRAQFRRLEEKYLTSNRQLEERIEECARLRADAEEREAALLSAGHSLLSALADSNDLLSSHAVTGDARAQAREQVADNQKAATEWASALGCGQSKHGVKR